MLRHSVWMTVLCVYCVYSVIIYLYVHIAICSCVYCRNTTWWTTLPTRQSSCSSSWNSPSHLNLIHVAVFVHSSPGEIISLTGCIDIVSEWNCEENWQIRSNSLIDERKHNVPRPHNKLALSFVHDSFFKLFHVHWWLNTWKRRPWSLRDTAVAKGPPFALPCSLQLYQVE